MRYSMFLLQNIIVLKKYAFSCKIPQSWFISLITFSSVFKEKY